jgi:hypothetical protein
MDLPPAVIVHGLDMARAATASGRPVTLLSAEGAGAYAGVGWWQALVEATRLACPHTAITDILDCGFAPGRALEALRAGQRTLVLRADPRVWADISERTITLGGVLLAEAPPALDLSEPGARRHLHAWLAA